MNIRIGNENDVKQGSALIQAYIKEIKSFKNKILYPAEYYDDLCMSAAKDKTVIIAEEEGKIVGVLFGIIMPNYLFNEQQLQVLVTWVRPDKRGSSAFIRMFKELTHRFGDKYNIVFKEIEETNLNYTKLNLTKIESSYQFNKKEVS